MTEFWGAESRGVVVDLSIAKKFLDTGKIALDLFGSAHNIFNAQQLQRSIAAEPGAVARSRGAVHVLAWAPAIGGLAVPSREMRCDAVAGDSASYRENGRSMGSGTYGTIDERDLMPC